MPANIKQANYQVALKILLRKGPDYLLLFDTTNRFVDLPGGRIDEAEHQAPLKKILEREVREELGQEVKFSLGNVLFQCRRHFGNNHVFLTVYEAEYLSGEISLSSEHSRFEWVHDGKFNLKEQEFFSKEEYAAFKNYFDQPK